MTQAPGWYADPFVRHEHRFHDGNRWTPYVKDGEVHATDEPDPELLAAAPVPRAAPTPIVTPAAPVVAPVVAPVAAPVVAPETPAAPTVPTVPAAALLTESVLVVRPAGTTAGHHTVHAPDGSRLGEVRQTATGKRQRIEVAGDTGALMTLSRFSVGRDRYLTVDDAFGTALGRIAQTKAWGRDRVGLEGPLGFAGYLIADDWGTWTLHVQDRVGRTVARIGKSGPGVEPLTNAGWVVTIDDAITDVLRPVALAATLAADVVFTGDGLLGALLR